MCYTLVISHYHQQENWFNVPEQFPSPKWDTNSIAMWNEEARSKLHKDKTG